MTAIILPLNLRRSAGADSSARYLTWLRALPGVVNEYAGRWSLRLGPPFEPGGQTAWVAPARHRDGRDLVLKVAWQHEEALHEADALIAAAGNGTVLLHDSGTAENTQVLLLERCSPGTPLGQALPEPDQDSVVAGLLRQLWTVPHDHGPFRPLRDMCDAWAAEFEQSFGTAPGGLDPGLARAGIDLFRTLPRTANQQALLWTDLHAGNIIAAERQPWLVIDPKPFVGDPTYDALQHLLNCERRLTADPVGLACRMADLLDLDRDRLRSWLFARCVQQSLDWPWLVQVAARLAPP
jgi:streptomycin 6-kinase